MLQILLVSTNHPLIIALHPIKSHYSELYSAPYFTRFRVSISCFQLFFREFLIIYFSKLFISSRKFRDFFSKKNRSSLSNVALREVENTTISTKFLQENFADDFHTSLEDVCDIFRGIFGRRSANDRKYRDRTRYPIVKE